MLEYFWDKWTTARLKAKSERVVQQRVLEMLEQRGPTPVADDAAGWMLAGGGKNAIDGSRREELRDRARRLVQGNPYARNLLRLFEVYVTGPGLRLTPVPRAGMETTSSKEAEIARGLWDEFLRANRDHFSFREYARRAWRDGESFLRLYPTASWPPTVRFVDPEAIGPTREEPDTQGILTDADDVESVRGYVRLKSETGELLETVPADEMLHTRLGADTNEKRGVTIFASVLDSLACYERWLETELQARKLQASIVLWRRVQGSPTTVSGIADGAASHRDRQGTGRERYQPGSIITTSQGTDLQFLQPDTNFGDAVPLGRIVLLSIAAGAGVPEFMLSADASNGNYASTMVAEGPAVKLFESEQQFFAGEFERLWRWVMGEATRLGLLSEDFLEKHVAQWSFPQLVNRDRPRERLADVRLIEAGVLSRAEVARRDSADPEAMRREWNREAESQRVEGEPS